MPCPSKVPYTAPTVKLNGLKDWTQWLEAVEAYSNLLGVWNFVDPEQDAELKEPTRPNFDINEPMKPLYDYDEDQDEGEEEDPEWCDPDFLPETVTRWGSYESVKKRICDIQRDAISRFILWDRFEFPQYKIDYQVYRDNSHKLSLVLDFIVDSVSSEYSARIAKSCTCRGKITILKDIMDEARDQCEMADNQFIGILREHATYTPVDWSYRVQKIYTECKNLESVLSSDDVAYIKFNSVISDWVKKFYELKEYTPMPCEIRENEEKFEDVLDNFRCLVEWYQDNMPRSA
ncbi:hypothetical protein CDD82_7836 [Ophiocordyceps australis]|uniref:Uncharacterized protein n=1 Tax=Ophiocordyceps australis TaxID=1399860 RepID=A0A2C5ZQV2_9HYPO|nr:hypothetical protein CDD82_7836 [Ophiocordyceps australis]